MADVAFKPGRVEFALRLPATDAQLRANVEHALSLGLPEADERDMPLNIVANGPSARGAAFDGPTMALNGAINLFAPGSPPDLWCAQDPQALVADFLKRPETGTTYLVASKCHPAVFERLQGFDVKLWHLSDVEMPRRRVPCATSITLTALMLAQRLGFRKIDVWGWDCCFASDGSHHAAEGQLGATPEPVEIELVTKAGNLAFTTTSTWGLEAQEALNILPVLEWCGAEITIHGDGLVRTMRDTFKAPA